MKTLINIVLLPLFLVYQIIIFFRNYLYDKKILNSTKLPCKIISIGNITIGGTGKTPTVMAIAKFLQQHNKEIAILSRGYGRKSRGTRLVTDGRTIPNDWESFGDEPLLMAKSLSGIPIVVDENRVRGGQFLIANYHPEIIILDDGFQHRKISRDIDIVLINSNISKLRNRIFGFGNFREPWKALKRAHIIFLTKSDIVPISSKLQLKLDKFNLPLFKTNLNTASHLSDCKNNKININNFKGKSVLLFSGIADNQSFENLVQKFDFTILDSIYFKDHNNYSKSDIDKIHSKYKRTNADIIITTEKDIIKISETDLPLFSIPITMGIGKNAYDKILQLIN